MRHGETGQTGFRSTRASKPSGQIVFLLPNPVKVPSSATRPAAGVTCLIAAACRAEVRGAPHYMNDLQNKGLMKWAFCHRLILKSLYFCGQADTKGCARWKRIRPGSADRDAFATVWLTRCGVIYENKYSTGYINVKLKVGGFARAGGLGRPPLRDSGQRFGARLGFTVSGLAWGWRLGGRAWWRGAIGGRG